MDVFIRRVQAGDESALAYIQTESWKAAFQNILDKDTLDRNTDIDRSTRMYRRLLEEKRGNGYILTLDGQPHCILRARVFYEAKGFCTTEYLKPALSTQKVCYLRNL